LAKVAVIYYSSTGNTYEVAKAIAEGAKTAGAEVRLRKVKELAPPEAIAGNPAWGKYLEASKDVAEASLDDLEWADAYAFGSPTRFGAAASQMRQFIDTTGGLWYAGKLSNKAATAFSGASTIHGGIEVTLQSFYATFMHWGDILVPPGYTNPIMFESGSPYGAAHIDTRGQSPLPDHLFATARYQGQRLARVADALLTAKDLS
jgi:NAD(P)H dehydrogenase (quinone)